MFILGLSPAGTWFIRDLHRQTQEVSDTTNLIVAYLSPAPIIEAIVSYLPFFDITNLIIAYLSPVPIIEAIVSYLLFFRSYQFNYSIF